MKHVLLVPILLIAAILQGACTSSAEGTSPATAAPPLPTAAAPTAIPFDLTVTVTDSSGVPVAGAGVTLPESGIGESVRTDAQGKYTWTNLPGNSASITVVAQGYQAGQRNVTLQRGPNEVTITLERAPFGLLPSDACAPGETLLFAEDFQDGQVENWGSYPQGTSMLIEADSAEAGNQVLSLNFGKTDGEFDVNAIPFQDNVVRRLKYKPGNHSRFNAGWGAGNNGYFVILSADEFSLNYYSKATGEQKLVRGKPNMAQGVWHLLELSSFDGKIEVWADGKLVASYAGNSLSDGHILGIGSAFLPPESIVRIDDVSICGLKTAFTTNYKKP